MSTRVASPAWPLPRPYLRRGTGFHCRIFTPSWLDRGASPDNSCANQTPFPKFWNWTHIVVAVLWSPVKVGARAGIWVGAAHLDALYAEVQADNLLVKKKIERNKCGARRDKRSEREGDREIQVFLIGSFQLWDLNAPFLLGKGELPLESCIASLPPPSLLPSNCTQCPGHRRAENSILLGQIGVERSFIDRVCLPQFMELKTKTWTEVRWRPCGDTADECRARALTWVWNSLNERSDSSLLVN